VERRKIKNLYFKKKIPVEKLMPKRENKTAKQEEQKAVAKIAEKIPDKAPRIPINMFLPEYYDRILYHPNLDRIFTRMWTE
jgi:hypothetical protein